MGTPVVPGVVVPGHGVASGRSGDARFPGGTLYMQLPLFAERGLDLSAFHRATINLSIAPRVLMPLEPRVTFRGVRWHPTAPPEDFSFFDCRIGSVPNHLTPALVYFPHPETKPRHLQPPTVVEILAPFLPGVGVGRTLWLWVDPGQAVLVEVTLDR